MKNRVAREFAEAHEHLSAGLNALARLLLSLVIVGLVLLARGARRLRKHFYAYKCLDCGRRGHRECDGSRRELSELAEVLSEAPVRTMYLGRIGGRR